MQMLMVGSKRNAKPLKIPSISELNIYSESSYGFQEPFIYFWSSISINNHFWLYRQKVIIFTGYMESFCLFATYTYKTSLL